MQGDTRIDSSSISVSLALHSTNQISAKKYVARERTEAVIQSWKAFGVRQPIFAFADSLRLFPCLW